MKALRRTFAALVLAVPLLVRADGLDADLDSLLLPEVSVTSSKPLPLRESPGVVTVISSEDIANAGARDLLDVLRLVPGVFSGVDVQGVVSFGFRGLWGQEGKILLLVDGQEFNEPLYASLAQGQRLPVDRIQRVEVIRGPGSAAYGGAAELGVINVVTKSEGVGTSFSHGRGRTAAIRSAMTAWAGLSTEKARLHATVSGGQGVRGDRRYTDAAGEAYDMRGASGIDPSYANVLLETAGATLRLISDRTRTTYRDHYDVALPEPVRQNFDGYFAELKRPFRPAAGWTVTPSVKYKWQNPWYVPDNPTYAWHRWAERTSYRLSAERAPSSDLSLTAGGEYVDDTGRSGDPVQNNLFADGNDALRFHTAALFAEGLARSPFAVVTLGGRYEKNSRFGSVFVPRAALTRVWGTFHAKALFARAFRAPSLMNVDLNPDIRPEKTTTLEFEAGWKVTGGSLLSVNVFDTSIRDPIVYTLVAGQETYLNFDRSGTRGLELSQLWRSGRGHSAALTYAFYRAHDNGVDLTSVPGRPGRFLAAPAHRATGSLTAALPWGASLTPAVEYVGARDGFDFDAAQGAMDLRAFGPAWVTDMTLNLSRLAPKGLSALLSVHNLFAADVPFVQPYGGGHPPLPGMGREWGGRISYEAAF